MRVRVDQTFSDRVGDMRAKSKCGNEIEECRPEDRLQWRQYARRDDRGDRIGRVVKAVEKVKGQSDRDDEDDESQHVSPASRHPFFSTMRSSVLPTSSQPSMASSMRS